MSRAATTNRVSVGFQGGQVLALRISADELKSLNRALSDGGWHEVTAEDATVKIDLGQVVYVRTDRDESHVGFGA
ncbi:MAG: hypothetical protein QOI98_2070 [Solirubrobacteraceae bacterium]|nr:hypothetical protein [Solirubrobacteraceae bacterium]